APTPSTPTPSPWLRQKDVTGRSLHSHPIFPTRRRIMRTKTMVQAAILVALGALLGYAAASGQLRPDRLANAANPDKAPAADRPAGGAPCPDCCTQGANPEQLVARADRDAADDPKKPAADGKKPNILVIFGDDIGQSNVSAYTHGLMGYQTPNI